MSSLKAHAWVSLGERLGSKARVARSECKILVEVCLRNKTFISYRRSDSSGFSSRLHSVLVKRYGNDQVYFDRAVDGMGYDWWRRITNALENAAAILVIIGPDWASCFTSDRSRDWTRLEVAAALKIDASRRVIPVLADASMPDSASLPDEVRKITSLQAFRMSQRPYEWGPGYRLLFQELDRLGVQMKRQPEEKRRNIFRAVKTFSHTMENVTPQRAGEALYYVLETWRYQILSVDEDDASISFHWGSRDDRFGKSIQLIYSKLDEGGTIATIDRYELGARLTLRVPTARRMAYPAVALAYAGVPLYGLAAKWDSRLAYSLFSALDRQLSGRNPGPDPLRGRGDFSH